MITLVEALGFRSLRYISQPLGPFHVLRVSTERCVDAAFLKLRDTLIRWFSP